MIFAFTAEKTKKKREALIAGDALTLSGLPAGKVEAFKTEGLTDQQHCGHFNIPPGVNFFEPGSVSN